MQIAKTKQSCAIWKESAPTRMLHHSRLTASEIADRPIAHPGILKFHTRRLDAAKLAARMLKIRLIIPRRCRHGTRVAHTPSDFAQPDAFFRIAVAER